METNSPNSTSPVTFESSESWEAALDRAAALHGIEPDYWDIFGKYHVTSPEGKVALLQALGVSTGTKEDLDRAVEERLWSEWSNPLPATLVVSAESGPLAVSVSLPVEMAEASLDLEIACEDGSSRTRRADMKGIPTTGTAFLRSRHFVRKQTPLSDGLPLGYHTLAIRSDNRKDFTGTTKLIVCPDRTYQSAATRDGGKTAGVMFHLPGVRSIRNWGCGDTTDLRALIDWTADEVQAGFVALNPLHALANRAPYNTSPYLPVSIFHRNLIYIDVEKVHDFAASHRARAFVAKNETQREIEELRDSEFVEYERVSALKIRALKRAFVQFLRSDWRKNTPRAEEFRGYLAREGEMLERFAIFCALDEEIHRRNPNIWIWPDWSSGYHDPDSEATRAFARIRWRRVLFVKYVQWQLDHQLAAAQAYARERGLPIGLYHDLALATDRYGSDFWGYRPYFVAGCRVGSPPDKFAPEGQDWAFPPPNTRHHWETGYRLFRESIRRNCSHGGALRIDHVMRFFRLFWIPDGSTPARGAYVRDAYEDLIRILALESVRNQVVVVGEDLGTVEPYIRETMAKYGILNYKVLFFERDGNHRFKAPREYPREAIVSSTTHDLPTLAGFWLSRDIHNRVKAGVFPESGIPAALQERELEKQGLLDSLFAEGLLPDWHPRRAGDIPELSPEMHNAFVGFIASTPSMLLVLNQEDLTKESEQQNLPGTTSQHPNWSRKMRYRVEELYTHPVARGCSIMFRDWIRKTSRNNRV